jgi:crossover junction endodeoxyribonuclease RuvC
MGYAVVDSRSPSMRVLVMDVLKMNSRTDNYVRLQQIYEKVQSVINEYKPDSMAIEAPFFGKNVQSMLKLGRAQGVAIAASMAAGLPVAEYAPRKVKQAITGNGNAAKEQVWKMLQQMMPRLENSAKMLDASDALAVAICHFYECRTPVKTKQKKWDDWASFLEQHPGKMRIRK